MHKHPIAWYFANLAVVSIISGLISGSFHVGTFWAFIIGFILGLIYVFTWYGWIVPMFGTYGFWATIKAKFSR